MGLLDDAKDKLGDAAEWVKDKTGHLPDTQSAGQTLGAKAAEARNWVEGRIGGDGPGQATTDGTAAAANTEATGDDSAGDASSTSDWIDASADPAMGGPQAGESPAADDALHDEQGPQNPL